MKSLVHIYDWSNINVNERLSTFCYGDSKDFDATFVLSNRIKRQSILILIFNYENIKQ